MSTPASVRIRIDSFTVVRNDSDKPITLRFANTRFLDHPREGVEFDLTEEEAVSIASAIVKFVTNSRPQHAALDSQ